MKAFAKFLKYFLLTIICYIVAYIIYTVGKITNKVDTHFVVVFGIVIVFLHWMFIGMIYPKKLPFWRGIKSRIIIVMIGLIFISCAVGGFVAIETYLLKRNPVKVVYINIYYLYKGLSHIHPFTEHALTKVNSLEMKENPQVAI